MVASAVSWISCIFPRSESAPAPPPARRRSCPSSLRPGRCARVGVAPHGSARGRRGTRAARWVARRWRGGGALGRLVTQLAVLHVENQHGPLQRRARTRGVRGGRVDLPRAGLAGAGAAREASGQRGQRPPWQCRRRFRSCLRSLRSSAPSRPRARPPCGSRPSPCASSRSAARAIMRPIRGPRSRGHGGVGAGRRRGAPPGAPPPSQH